MHGLPSYTIIVRICKQLSSWQIEAVRFFSIVAKHQVPEECRSCENNSVAQLTSE